MKLHHIPRLAFPAICFACLSTAFAAETATAKKSDFPKPPGVVIDHIPASSGMYIGSPAIAVLPDGRYVASHDLFGPKIKKTHAAITRIFTSDDHGKTWRRLDDVNNAVWSSLFVHRGQLYLQGPFKYENSLVIRRSSDGGKTWTVPKDKSTGLLFDDAKYHTAPVPIVVHNGRIWRAVEDCMNPGGWGAMFRARMISALEDSDLLKAANWTMSNPLTTGMTGSSDGWLEGNAVVAPDNKIVNILRVNCLADREKEKVAVIRLSDDGRTATFNANADFLPFPGGSKKFTIRFDPETKLYWTLTNYVLPADYSNRSSTIRNTLALANSADLINWTVKSIILHHPDPKMHAFQYIDWLFDGDDLIAVSRTAFDDAQSGANRFHDANYMTFHRIRKFRTLNTGPEKLPKN